MDKEVIWSHINTLRFKYLKKFSLLECQIDMNDKFIKQDLIAYNVEKVLQIVGIKSLSEKINKNFSKSDITEAAELFLALNSCPSFFEKLYWKIIYGPKQRIAMSTSNIIKKAKGDLKEEALNVFAKVSSVLGFQRVYFHHKGNESLGEQIKLTKNILDIKGEMQFE